MERPTNRYASYILTDFYKYVTKLQASRPTPENMHAYGWLRMLTQYINECIEDGRDFIIFPGRDYNPPSADTISRLCRRFLGRLDTLPDEANEERLILAAVQAGCVDALNYNESIGRKVSANVLAQRLMCGTSFGVVWCMRTYPDIRYDVNSLIWLIKHNYQTYESMLTSAARSGHEKLTRYLMARLPKHPHFTSSLVSGGLLNIVMEIDRIEPIAINYDHVITAIRSNNIDALDWILSRKGRDDDVWKKFSEPELPGNDYSAHGYAILYSSEEALAWLESHEIPLQSGVLFGAAFVGNTQLLQKMLDRGVRWSPKDIIDIGNPLSRMIYMGRKLEQIQAVYEKGAPVDADVVYAAIGRDRFDVLEWLMRDLPNLFQNNDYSISRREAVRLGQIEMLDWLFAKKLIS